VFLSLFSHRSSYYFSLFAWFTMGETQPSAPFDAERQYRELLSSCTHRTAETWFDSDWNVIAERRYDRAGNVISERRFGGQSPRRSASSFDMSSLRRSVHALTPSDTPPASQSPPVPVPHAAPSRR
jgi:hypothetical protein